MIIAVNKFSGKRTEQMYDVVMGLIKKFLNQESPAKQTRATHNVCKQSCARTSLDVVAKRQVVRFQEKLSLVVCCRADCRGAAAGPCDAHDADCRCMSGASAGVRGAVTAGGAGS